MESEFLKDSQTFSKFMKANAVEVSLQYNYKRYFPTHKHPSLILEQIYEVHQHNKKLICIDSATKTGKSSSAIFFLLDQFLQSAPSVERAEDVGCYLIIIASSRDQSTAKYEMITQLLQSNESVQTVDINSFFPLNHKGIACIVEYCLGKLPKVSLPPVSMPTILIATPSTFMKLVSLSHIDQNGVWGVLYDECDLIRIYGGQDQLKEVFEWVQQQTCQQKALNIFVGASATVESVTSKATTVIKVECEEQEEPEQKPQPTTNAGNIFYSVARDDTQKFIILYITLRLNLIQGKTLIIVPDLNQLYKCQLFFQRSGIEKFQIYNYENPKTLKYYILSTFNTGVISTLIATPHVFQEIHTIFFNHRAKPNSTKKDPFYFKHLDNIITVDVDPNKIEFTHHLNGFGNVIAVQSREEASVEQLLKWLQRNTGAKEYPLTVEEIEAFRYRVHDVIANISKHQIKHASQIDFKKKMLKSPDLIEYFKTNPKEKEILQQQLVRLKADLRKSEIVITGQVPDYLLPEVIKHQRKTQGETPKRLSRILVHQHDASYDKVKEKRRLLSQDPSAMLPKPLEQQEEEIDQVEPLPQQYFQRLVKKLKLNNEKFIYVDEDKEDPELVDPSKLRTISSRKLWKLKHGFKLKKSNKRLERKGIFQA